MTERLCDCVQFFVNLEKCNEVRVDQVIEPAQTDYLGHIWEKISIVLDNQRHRLKSFGVELATAIGDERNLVSTVVFMARQTSPIQAMLQGLGIGITEKKGINLEHLGAYRVLDTNHYSPDFGYFKELVMSANTKGTILVVDDERVTGNTESVTRSAIMRISFIKPVKFYYYGREFPWDLETISDRDLRVWLESYNIQSLSAFTHGTNTEDVHNPHRPQLSNNPYEQWLANRLNQYLYGLGREIANDQCINLFQ